MQRPRYTAEDFKAVANKIRYDLTAAQAKLTDLMQMIATVDLPTEDQPYTIERGEAYVREVGWMYTDSSLTDDLKERGASEADIPLLLAIAAQRRSQVLSEVPAA
jgi:hypothetical protein